MTPETPSTGVEVALPDALRAAAARELERLQRRRVVARLWERDETLWVAPSSEPATERLGWLRLPSTAERTLRETAGLLRMVRAEGVEDIVLIGMGGSSLGAAMVISGHDPETLPRFSCLDSTHPQAVRDVLERCRPGSTWTVVASKSGRTLETLCLTAVVQEWMRRGGSTAVRQSVAITDAGSPLARRAEAEAWRAVLTAPSDVGGRFSVLGPFGLVPARLVGCDLDPFVRGAAAMSEACGPRVALDEHPAALLACALAAAWRSGRDLLELRCGSATTPLAAWLEQLVGESLGKDGRGLLPLVRSDDSGIAADPGVLVTIEEGAHRRESITVRLPRQTPRDLGAAIFCWELTVALLGWIMEVQPFDQPDVERSKRAARGILEGAAASGSEAFAVDDPQVEAALSDWRERAEECRWCTIQAFLPPSEARGESLAGLAAALSVGTGKAVGWGWGPRYLHSTGQLHKGGPPVAALQLVDHPTADLEVPGSPFTLVELLHAQAEGDATALEQLGMPVLRVGLGSDRDTGLQALLTTVRELASG